MDIQALKLELVEQLVTTNHVSVLTEVKRLLEVLQAETQERTEEEEEGLIAAAAIFGQNSYGDDEPDINGLVLKEPEPPPILQARLKRMIDEQNDPGFLARVAAFIQQDQDAERWKEVLTARVARSEADFKAGHVFTQEEVKARFKAGRTSR